METSASYEARSAPSLYPTAGPKRQARRRERRVETTLPDSLPMHMEAEEQLRAEQAKLGGLEDRVEQLEKALGTNPQ